MPLGTRAFEAFAGRVRGAGVAAKEVHFPAGLNAELGGVGDACGLLVEAAAGIALCVERGQQRGARRDQGGAGLFEFGLRLGDRGAGGLRLANQGGKQGIVLRIPPPLELRNAAAMRQRCVPLGGDGGIRLRGRTLNGATNQRERQQGQRQSLQRILRHE